MGKTTQQLDLYNNKIYPHYCKWCGRGFDKTHNRQMYCSKECSHMAHLEQKAIYQRKRRKLINMGLLVSDENTKLGTGYLSKNPYNDFDKEYKSIQKELKRLLG